MLSTIPNTTLHINQVYLISTVASEVELRKAFASKKMDKIGQNLLFPQKIIYCFASPHQTQFRGP